jgi:alkanesulfonate monooxygenase SsuD/methylene tetrahydromethanopterin reductase-like flavin-dependent oxidoreductase (luciferase family)
LDEVLEVCKRLWTEDVIEHHGEFFDFEPVAFEPKPVQRPWPPIQIGGESDAAFRRIAQHGNGWLAHEHTHESFKEPYGRFREVLEAQGRSLDSVDITIARQPSTPDDVARWEEEFGVKRIILFPGSRATGGDALRAMEEFAEGFMAQ